MKDALFNHLLHNPFQNRFNAPVTRRRDDMQAEAYIGWLRERNLEHSGFKIPKSVEDVRLTVPSVSTHARKLFAGVFAVLLVIIVSMAVLLKAL